MMSNRPVAWGDRRRPARVLRWSVVVLVVGALLVLLYRQLVPDWLHHSLIVAVLYAGRAAYVTAVGAAAAVFAGAVAWAAWARSRGRAWQPAARWALPAAAVLLMIVPVELVAARILTSSQRLPQLPTQLDAPSDANPGAPRARTIVVIGESSARGEPYDLSLAQIAAWQLERVFPGTRFEVDMRARGGLDLEQAISYLEDLERRPDAVLIYSGHNEFQARFRWSRNVAYYADEAPTAAPAALLRGVVAVSPFYRLMDQALERHRLDRPPPPRATRQLVDRPVFTAEEYAFLRDDYRLRLDDLLTWCNRIGTLPIVVVPAGNDTDFPPSRSYLDPTTSADERRRFASDFESAHAMEQDGSADALAAYRALIDRQPLFAEAHYRYAQLLRRSGAPTGDHFTRARDLDGMPMRLPGDFRAAARRAAIDHGAVLIDAQRVLGADRRADLFHDGQHPTLAGYIALARDLLEQLRERHAFGWPDSAPVPALDTSECVAHFGIDTRQWAKVCQRTAEFYGRIAYIRFDPSPHLTRALQYEEAARRIESGAALDGLDLVALGIDPAVIQQVAAGSANDAGGRIAGVAETPGAAAAASAPRADGATPRGDAKTEAGGQPAAAAAVDACRQIAARLAGGDRSALESLPPSTRSALAQDPGLANVVLCLAIANDDDRYCDALQHTTRENCSQQWKFMRELKAVPAESLKSQMIYRTCLGNSEKADCDLVLEALTAHDPTKCEGLSQAPTRIVCAALVTGDAARCEKLPLRAEQGFCAALATDDPNRCPKEDAKDCLIMARAFATWRLKGPEDAQVIDPIAATIRWGKPSFCAPLMADFERTCAESKGPPQ